MKNRKVSFIQKALEKDGWYLAYTKGDHRQFKHPTKSGKVTLSGKDSADVDGSLLKSIEKQSGLNF